MTTTPPDAPSGPSAGHPGDQGPRVTRDEMRDLGRLRRSATDRKVAGVAGGLARHLDIDPLILRVLFVVLAFFGGAGLILYGACWLLVPDEQTGDAAVTLDDRSRTLALLIVGAIAVFALVGDSWGVFWFPWPLAIIAVVVLVILTRKDRPAPPPGSGGAPYMPVHDQPAATYQTAPGATYPYPPVAQPAPGQEAGSGYTAPTQQWTAPTYPGYEGYDGGTGQQAPVKRQAPRDPRRRGPILFWFTLALIALGIGVLGTVDLAGAPVANSAYPALAVGITGVMLLVGAFWGRAGGLILLGLLTTVGLAGTTAADNWDGTTRTYTPDTAAEVESSYDFNTGELILDLTEVTDLQNLDGRNIELDGGVGRIEVILPDGLDAEVEGRVGGPGAVDLFGLESGGIDTHVTRRHDGGVDAPLISIDARMGVGEITVDTE